MQAAINLNRQQFADGQTISVDLAWSAYAANPDRFHQVTSDNEDGSPILDLILGEGPWWVSVYFDHDSDPAFPGWVLRYTTDPAAGSLGWCDVILTTTDPDDKAGALVEAEAWLVN